MEWTVFHEIHSSTARQQGPSQSYAAVDTL